MVSSEQWKADNRISAFVVGMHVEFRGTPLYGVVGLLSLPPLIPVDGSVWPDKSLTHVTLGPVMFLGSIVKWAGLKTICG